MMSMMFLVTIFIIERDIITRDGRISTDLMKTTNVQTVYF